MPGTRDIRMKEESFMPMSKWDEIYANKKVKYL